MKIIKVLLKLEVAQQRPSLSKICAKDCFPLQFPCKDWNYGKIMSKCIKIMQRSVKFPIKSVVAPKIVYTCLRMMWIPDISCAF